MIKVLRIINRLNLGGPTFNAALLSKYLPDNYKTILVAGTKQDSEESSNFIVHELDLDFISIPNMQREINPIKDYKAYCQLKKIMMDYKPDIVHTHAAKSGTLGRLAAIHCKVPVVLHTFHGHIFHSYFSGLTTKLFLRIEKYIAKRTSAIIAISERQKYELSEIHKVCSPEKIKVIPLGFDLTRFRTDIETKRKLFRDKYFITNNEIVVTIVGRLVPVKNHALFLNAAAKILKSTEKKIRFLIVGDGELRDELLTLCKSLNLDYTYFPKNAVRADVTFCSWMKDVDVAISGSDIVALTSFNEGTPVSLIEAQAGNKPIVTTKVGGIENIVIENETALLCENNNEKQFTKQLLSLIENNDKRTAMSVKGWDFVRDKFHYQRLIRDMDTFYQEQLALCKKK